MFAKEVDSAWLSKIRAFERSCAVAVDIVASAWDIEALRAVLAFVEAAAAAASIEICDVVVVSPEVRAIATTT